jgi:hypothetical protein
MANSDIPAAGSRPSYRLAFARFLAAFVLALAPFEAAQAGDVPAIPFVAKAGDRYTVEIGKDRVTTKNGAVERHERMLAAYDAVIESAGKDGLVLVWTLASKRVEDIVPSSAPSLDIDALMRAVDIPIRIEADRFALPLKIANRADVVALMRAKLEADGKAGASGTETSWIADIKAAAERSLFIAAEDAFAATVLPEAALLSRVHAAELPRDKPLEQVSFAPNPWGGPPMSFIERFQVFDENDAALTIRVEGNLDPKSVKDSIEALLQSVADEKGISVEDARESLGLVQFARNDKTTYVVSKASGWTEKIISIRKTYSNSPGQNLERIETVEVAVTRK